MITGASRDIGASYAAVGANDRSAAAAAAVGPFTRAGLGDCGANRRRGAAWVTPTTYWSAMRLDLIRTDMPNAAKLEVMGPRLQRGKPEAIRHCVR